VIHCPDCGGVVGATQVTDAGPPCRCFGELNGSSDSSGTQVLDSPAPIQKICCRCGKDLTGKKRLRDSEGYWCVDCHRADKKQNQPAGVKCPSCGRTVPPDSLSNYDNERICSRCVKEKRQIKKAGEKKFRVVDGRKFDAYEKKQALIVAGVLLVLAGIMILRWMHIIGE
jgi:DNA-directed RNA polymerase subunit RPC12/RpoP